MIYLLFACALALSGIAAFYSIAGLIAIFAAAPIPIAIMGSALEVSKLVIASWLYRNWKPIPLLMKTYLTTSLIVLMFLTSMGIFGFLSKAHLDQAVPTGDVAAKLALIDEKIKTERENIDAARTQLRQLDQQVDQTIARTTDAAGADRSITIRRQQAKERAASLKAIEQAQTNIAKLNEERAPIATQLRKVEAEVGPIKYIAALIYDQPADGELLEKAVRWVTLLIVAVFDPLAVVMLIAANWTIVHNNRNKHTITKQPADRVDDQPEQKVDNTPQQASSPIDISSVDSNQPASHEASPDLTPPPPPVEHPAFNSDDQDYWRSRPHARHSK